MRVPGRVSRCNVVQRGNGEGLGLHPRGQAGDGRTAGQWEDGGMTRGQQDDRRTME